MRIGQNRRQLLICLLLCALLLTSYSSALSVNGLAYSDVNVFNGASLSGSLDHSSMSGGDAGIVDYTATTTISPWLFGLSPRPTRLPHAKMALALLIVILSAQIISLIHSTRLTASICPQYHAIQIATFLHKKDGMK